MSHLNLDCSPKALPTGFSTETSSWAVHRDDVPIEGGFNPDYGNVTWQTMICNDRMNSHDLVLGVGQIPAFGKLPLHHHDPAEFYFVTMGDGEITIDGNIILARSGMAIFIPGGAEHGIDAGPNGMEFIYGFPQNRFADVIYSFPQQQDSEQ